MSEAYWKVGGLRFWSEQELVRRDSFVQEAVQTVTQTLTGINPAWTVHRCETPILLPRNKVLSEYIDRNDVWTTREKILDEWGVLRPETTQGSYEVARRLNLQGRKFPMCVWQVGKSFRTERNDGASASKMRFWEFNQLEFQCIYSISTKADYRQAVLANIGRLISRHTECPDRIVPSDRLPSYSLKTDDIEVFVSDRWTEMSSVSTRADFSESHEVLEIAIGVDRIVEAAGREAT